MECLPVELSHCLNNQRIGPEQKRWFAIHRINIEPASVHDLAQDLRRLARVRKRVRIP